MLFEYSFKFHLAQLFWSPFALHHGKKNHAQRIEKHNIRVHDIFVDDNFILIKMCQNVPITITQYSMPWSQRKKKKRRRTSKSNFMPLNWLDGCCFCCCFYFCYWKKDWIQCMHIVLSNYLMCFLCASLIHYLGVNWSGTEHRQLRSPKYMLFIRINSGTLLIISLNYDN